MFSLLRAIAHGRIGILAYVAVLLSCASGASAQPFTFVGSEGCTSCHEDAGEKLEKFHGGALAQVGQKDGQAWAAALGVPTTSPVCLKCHGPDETEAPQTISCETCHGAASAYDRPHRRRSFYVGLEERSPEKQGLVNYFNRPSAIAERCVGCHVLDAQKDRDVLKAGHKNYPSFDLYKKLLDISHFDDPRVVSRPRTPNYADVAKKVAEEGAPLIKTRLASVGVPAKTDSGPRPGPTPRAGGTSGPTGGGGTLPPPWPQPAPPEDSGRDDPGQVEARRSPSPPTRPPARGDASPSPRAATDGSRRTPPPSPGTLPSVTPGPPASPEVGSPPATPAPARPMSVVELRGELVRRLTKRVKDGRTIALAAAPSPPAEFDGPDGELLAIQDEALCLALQVLSGQPCPQK